MLLVLTAVASPLFGASSVYPSRLEDSQAIYLTPDLFSVHTDGPADDSAAIQQAIDRVQESTGQGILLIPSGRCCLSGAIRLIGYGPSRPVFVLADDTPGLGSALAALYAVGNEKRGSTLLRRPTRNNHGRAVPRMAIHADRLQL